MENKIKIGFITTSDPNDKKSWSGTYYRMLKALEGKGFEVIALGPISLGRYSTFFIEKSLHYLGKLHNLLFRKKYNRGHNHLVSYFHGRFFRQKLKENKVDVIFAPAASNEIAHLRTKIPICYFSDATISVIMDYYESFSGFSNLSMKEGNNIEQRAINNSKAQVFSSKWAFDSAVSDYNAQNPFIVKLGANIEIDPSEEVMNKNYDSTFELLFIGVDWKRKGGDIAYETLERLCDSGYDVNLTVLGTVPPVEHPKMKVIPSLNKNIESERLILENILSNSHLLFLPTRADCTPIVFCEANAFGLPVISTDTGGVSSVIEHGINGYLLPLSATSEDYFNVIESLISDKDKIKELAKTSRKKYKEELNWNTWGDRMEEILLLILK